MSEKISIKVNIIFPVTGSQTSGSCNYWVVSGIGNDYSEDFYNNEKMKYSCDLKHIIYIVFYGKGKDMFKRKSNKLLFKKKFTIKETNYTQEYIPVSISLSQYKTEVFC